MFCFLFLFCGVFSSQIHFTKFDREVGFVFVAFSKKGFRNKLIKPFSPFYALLKGSPFIPVISEIHPPPPPPTPCHKVARGLGLSSCRLKDCSKSSVLKAGPFGTVNLVLNLAGIHFSSLGELLRAMLCFLSCREGHLLRRFSLFFFLQSSSLLQFTLMSLMFRQNLTGSCL